MRHGPPPPPSPHIDSVDWLTVFASLALIAFLAWAMRM